jgi:hypothetical protein
MPDANVISDVSSTLQQLLHESLVSLDPQFFVDVSDLQGQMSTSPLHLTIFLFEVVEDPSAKNRPPVRQVVNQTVLTRKPPMALLLRYMLTPWSGDRITDHKILGKVIETFYDNANIAGTKLQGGLANTDAVLNINLAPITLEDRTRVWYSVQKPYRLSLTYEVRVVNLDSTLQKRTGLIQSRKISMERPGP